MSLPKSRRDYLIERYKECFADNALNLPERFDVDLWEDPKFREKIFKSHDDNVLQGLVDRELIELLSYINPGHARVLYDLISPEYHDLPNIMKYKTKEVIESTLFNHGPPIGLFGTILSLNFVPGVVFGNHRYSCYLENPNFDYNKYEKKLQQMFNIDEVVVQGVDNEILKDVGSQIYLTDIPLYTDAKPDYERRSCEHLWKFFSDVNIVYTDEVLRNVTKVVDRIESGTTMSLSFGQFAQVFPCMKHMKNKAKSHRSFDALYPTKLRECVFYSNMTCSSNFTEEQTRVFRKEVEKRCNSTRKRMRKVLPDVQCEVTYTIIVDFKHQLIVIRQTGTHCAECIPHQEQKGYPFYKRQVERYGVEVTAKLFTDALLQRYGKNNMSKQNQLNWAKKRTKRSKYSFKLKSSFLTNHDSSDDEDSSDKDDSSKDDSSDKDD